jgi:exosortase
LDEHHNLNPARRTVGSLSRFAKNNSNSGIEISSADATGAEQERQMGNDATWREVASASLRDPSHGRAACFALLVGLTLGAFWTPLSTLIQLAFQRDENSHILLLPLVSATLLFLERRKIFSHVETCWAAGSALLVVGALLNWLGRRYATAASQNDQLAITIFSVVVIWIGSFVLCYGLRAFRAGLFPMLFLFLMVPIPDLLLDRAIVWLQVASAEVSYVVFRLVGVPILRTGFVFELPRVTIEVARECSGIRSSLAMLITSLLAGHLFLRSGWTKVVLTLTTLPLLVIKNGIRIVSLTMLSVYVDPSFLTGRLHRSGGVLFFLLALVILAPVLRLLKKAEGP